MKISNRRYTGSKQKLMDWIKGLLDTNCADAESFFDVFGGTGVVTASLLDKYKTFYINDFLYSNEVIYKAFFLQENYDITKLKKIEKEYRKKDVTKLGKNYVSKNFGDKYFSMNDSKLIGYIRENIEKRKKKGEINEKEYVILLASLLYSFDRCANTVGHYEAYIKKTIEKDSFNFELVEPLSSDAKISIYRQDANLLADKITADVAFIDPPYNSRQYSRFYHVMETITKWDKPKLSGTAMKPPEENMSDYCRTKALDTFKDLINKLNVKYIVVTYNNTYDSKSSSSKNKISLEDIEATLKEHGETKKFEKSHKCFNAGKTDFDDHKEIVFITKVKGK